MNNPIAFALDFPTLGHAANFIRDNRLEPTIQKGELHHRIGAVKIGLELFIAAGPRAVQVFKDEMGIPVILDLKLHDIPETVARGVKAGGDLGVKYMTLHIQQRKALEEAVKAAESFGMTLLGVTVLTSMTEEDMRELSWSLVDSSVRARAYRMAEFGISCGLKGFVCSPQEVGLLKAGYPDAFFLVPGVRPAGSEVQDQKRVGTPSQAVSDGANLIVVGRPIRDAKDPHEAARAILASTV
jgi:orotidine-5'-phosphate decarboxylase